MKLVDIYRLRMDGYPLESLAAARQRLASLAQSDGDIWRQMKHLEGESLLDLNRFDEAAFVFNAIWEAINDPAALNNLAYAKYRAGRLEAALTKFQDAANVDPNNSEIALSSAVEIAHSIGKREVAVECLTTYLSRFESNEWAKRWLKVLAVK